MMSFFISYPAPSYFLFFFFNDPATTEIYTLSLHDALPICRVHMIRHRAPWDARSTISRSAHVLERIGLALTGASCGLFVAAHVGPSDMRGHEQAAGSACQRSEEHTSELQSHLNLLCRLLLA